MGCVYDHRVTQAILERRRRAKEAEGARIAPTRRAQPVRYTGRIRFYVAEDYRRQHAGYREPLRDLVDAASSVVGSSFGIVLETAELRDWSPRCGRERLSDCLDELAALDAGEDGAWVVGVLGDFPRFTASFEELGMAHRMSSHFVIRDVSNLAERAQIDEAFPTHTPSGRDEIYTRRKRHKRLSVFLHEWAHTLGGLHAPVADDLLNPSYDDRMSDFDDANAGLIAAALEDRFAQPAGGDAHLLPYVEQLQPARFVSGEQAALLALLRDRRARAADPGVSARAAAHDAPVAQAAPAAQPASAHADGALDALSPTDRDTFRAAERTAHEAGARAGLETLSPIVARYPASYAVQHLACTLSMQAGVMAAAQTSCPRVSKLSAPAR
ncbi:MAG: hypothetical protein JWN48_3458 [Myxococcaceae bacterium]|nr:hypothetical protein [Myxococcaceae bacterium]